MSDETTARLCGAKTRSGGTCKRAPSPGRTRCRLHGGANRTAGPLHHTYKHGRYSKALDREPINALYEIARTDPKLLALREDIALLIAKQQQTLEKLQTGESGPAWSQLGAALQLFADQLRLMGLPDEAYEALRDRVDAMQRIALGGLGDHHIWQEYTARAEQIRKLVDTERKYEEGLKLYLPMERANAIMGTWLAAVRRVVPEPYITALREELRKVRTGEPSMSPTGQTH